MRQQNKGISYSKFFDPNMGQKEKVEKVHTEYSLRQSIDYPAASNLDAFEQQKCAYCADDHQWIAIVPGTG